MTGIIIIIKIYIYKLSFRNLNKMYKFLKDNYSLIH